MSTPKELAIREVERTTDALFRDIDSFPLDRWREPAVGKANDLFGVLEHLLDCEPWWLINIGVPKEEWPPLREPDSFGSAQEMIDAYRGTRDHLLGLLREKPDEFFETRPETCEYGDFLQSGAELCFYMAEHDYYHNGQIQMLEMALQSE